MKKFFLFVLLSIVVNNFEVFAQYVPMNGKYVDKVSETTLAVVLMTEDTKELKKLKDKPEELKSYKESITKYNSMLKTVIEREWDVSKNFEFVSPERAEQIKKSKNPEYCILDKISVANYRMSTGTGNYFSGAFGNDITSYAMIVWGGKPKKAIVRSAIPLVDLPEVSMTFMIQHLKNQLFDYTNNGIDKKSKFKKEISKRSMQLQDRNLILYEKVVTSSLQSVINDGSLKEMYGYQYQSSNDENAIEIITTHKKGFVYPIVIPTGVGQSSTPLYLYCLIDSHDGRILYITEQFATRTRGQISENHLEMAYESVKEQMPN
ncbi:hypothetical protein OKW21_000594 [Catalinimonas alkaloidigena]|uniref:hypothetical protein n=1 Tax=Catalinimonas alkaloidigena TaxID=1075417 RepID=UPI002406F8A5|nr:hypothetical protein [Catalinimonas alkaloidigena]MDF9795331.1 hypothetical protein [Catalinimonas alkaloidigena]